MYQKSAAVQLLQSRRNLLAGGCRGALSALKGEFPDIGDNLYVIDHIPEQCEDIYKILIDGKTVATVEVPHEAFRDEPTLVNSQSIHDYTGSGRVTGVDRRTLNTALELAKQLGNDEFSV